jgi:hypothetical protein
MVNPDIGRDEGLRRMQKRAATTSLANLGMLLERFAQTGGDRFYGVFETAAQNVQGILDARQKARAKAAEQIQSARIIPVLLAVTLVFFMNDPGFRTSFGLPLVQIAFYQSMPGNRLKIGKRRTIEVWPSGHIIRT